MTDTLVQLKDFIVSSQTIDFSGEHIDNVLPGKFLVLRQDIDEDENVREGSLFLIHENFANEKVPLNEYNWKHGGSYDYEDDPVTLTDTSYVGKMSIDELAETLSDDMAGVIDNTVCFSMVYSDYGYDFDVLKNGDKVIGFRFSGIGSWINTQQVQLEQACTIGELQKVKELLTTSIPEKRATISYEAFYYACTNEHKEIIKYLLSSPELSEHSQINDKKDNRFTTPFVILCNSNPDIVKELISELPEKVVKEIRTFFENNISVTDERKSLIDSLNSREAKEKILNIRHGCDDRENESPSLLKKNS